MRLIATTYLIKITLVPNLDVINTPKPTWWTNALSESLLKNGDNRLWLKTSEGEDTDVGHWVGVAACERERPDDGTPGAKHFC